MEGGSVGAVIDALLTQRETQVLRSRRAVASRVVKLGKYERRSNNPPQKLLQAAAFAKQNPLFLSLNAYPEEAQRRSRKKAQHQKRKNNRELAKRTPCETKKKSKQQSRTASVSTNTGRVSRSATPRAGVSGNLSLSAKLLSVRKREAVNSDVKQPLLNSTIRSSSSSKNRAGAAARRLPHTRRISSREVHSLFIHPDRMQRFNQRVSGNGDEVWRLLRAVVSRRRESLEQLAAATYASSATTARYFPLFGVVVEVHDITFAPAKRAITAASKHGKKAIVVAEDAASATVVVIPENEGDMLVKWLQCDFSSSSLHSPPPPPSPPPLPNTTPQMLRVKKHFPYSTGTLSTLLHRYSLKASAKWITKVRVMIVSGELHETVGLPFVQPMINRCL